MSADGGGKWREAFRLPIASFRCVSSAPQGQDQHGRSILKAVNKHQLYLPDSKKRVHSFLSGPNGKRYTSFRHTHSLSCV